MGILHSEEEIVYHFFTETEFFTESEAVITGPDVNHIKNVLRMKPGEKLLLSDGKGTNCLCEITELFPDKVLAKILPEEVDDTELPVKVTLYQGLPKADKMEFIIQKCVELGVTKIVPVDTDRAVVKLDAKKAKSKLARWQAIAHSAAMQSGRMVEPRVHESHTVKQAVQLLREFDCVLVCWEECPSTKTIAAALEQALGNASVDKPRIAVVVGPEGGMALTRELIGSLKPGQSLSIFIGPEGGFSDGEVELAMQSGVKPVTLGKRILRTETAGMFVMAAVGLLLE